MMIGVDYHPSFQQIAFLMEETGEYSERRLNHSDGEAEKFYRDLTEPTLLEMSGNPDLSSTKAGSSSQSQLIKGLNRLIRPCFPDSDLAGRNSL